MIRYQHVIAVGMLALCLFAMTPAGAQTSADESQPARVSQGDDAAALSDRLSRVEGRIEGMEAANDQATRHAERVLTTVQWCTTLVSALVILVVGGLGAVLGFLEYRELQGIRAVRREAEHLLKETVREADEAVKAAATNAARAEESAGEATGYRDTAKTRAEELTDLLERSRAETEIGRTTDVSKAEQSRRVDDAKRVADELESLVEYDLSVHSPDINILNQLSGLLDRLGRYEDAVRYADIAIKWVRNDVGAWFNKAVIEIHIGGSAPEEIGKRRHWRESLRSFGEAKRLHDAGTRMNDVDYGKMWLFAGETAQYVAELEPTPEGRSDCLQKAAAWYDDGYVCLLQSLERATEHTRPAIEFWASNAKERSIKLHRLDRQAAAEGPQRNDIARRDNDIPFWREKDEQEFRKLVGLDEVGGEGA